MKVRNGFISNSSTTCFMVKFNNEDEKLRNAVGDIIKAYDYPPGKGGDQYMTIETQDDVHFKERNYKYFFYVHFERSYFSHFTKIPYIEYLEEKGDIVIQNLYEGEYDEYED